MDAAPLTEDVLYCTVHPEEATSLRCNKCGRPMCSRCAMRTPVGYRCRECVKGQQKVFYTGNSFDLVLQFVVAFPLSAIVAGLASVFGGVLGFYTWFIAIPASTAAGVLIADLAHRAAGRRRHEYGWIVVAAGVILGAVAVAAGPGLFFVAMMTQYQQQLAELPPEATLPMWMGIFGGFTSIGWWIYVVAATIAVVGRLRLGGRIRLRR